MQPSAPEYCMFFIEWWPLCMGLSEWAAWTQGIGTLFALCIAIAVPARQQRDAYKLKLVEAREERIRVIGICINLVGHLLRVATAIANQRDPVAQAQYDTWLRVARLLWQSLQSIPLGMMPTPDAAEAIYAAVGCAGEAIAMLELRRFNPPSDLPWDALIAQLADVQVRLAAQFVRP